MVEIPGKELFRKMFTGPASAIVAAIVGGLFSLIAAVMPYVMPGGASSTNPAPSPPPTPAVAQAEATPAPTPTIQAKQHLTYGTWTLIESHDDEGTDWSNSVLKFTKQIPTEDGLEVEGFFEWRSGQKLMGREYVRGNYVEATRNLYIEGERMENVAGELAIGSFSARLAEGNRQLIDGTWGSQAGQQSGVPGTWRARR